MYSEDDLREAFKAGWKKRDENPGLKRVAKRNMNNAILGAIGGARYADFALVPAKKTYHNSIWLNSQFKKSLAKRPVNQPGKVKA